MKKQSQLCLRKFQEEDLPQILRLFYETVHTVNIQDYSQEQVEAWAPLQPDVQRWAESLCKNIAYVAELNCQIVGFGDMTPEGYLDRLYTDREFQGQGIGSSILHKLEEEAKKLGIKEITTQASITAKPFFEHQGYKTIQPQEKKHTSGLIFLNYIMSKKL